jgi:protein subunit release factor A
MCDGNLAMANKFVDMSEADMNELHDREVKKMEKKIEEYEYYITTLPYDHQESLRLALQMKADNLREIINPSK